MAGSPRQQGPWISTLDNQLSSVMARKLKSEENILILYFRLSQIRTSWHQHRWTLPCLGPQTLVQQVCKSLSWSWSTARPGILRLHQRHFPYTLHSAVASSTWGRGFVAFFLGKKGLCFKPYAAPPALRGYEYFRLPSIIKIWKHRLGSMRMEGPKGPLKCKWMRKELVLEKIT